MVWYSKVLLFIDNYEKDMVTFDLKWAINDVEIYVFGAIKTSYDWLQ